MRVKPKIVFVLDGLSQEEGELLYELIIEAQHRRISQPEFSILEDLKLSFSQFEKKDHSKPCDGCDTLVSGSLLPCPIQGIELPLCEECYNKRLELAECKKN